ncbi:unnamed protein product [Caretta caretta]
MHCLEAYQSKEGEQDQRGLGGLVGTIKLRYGPLIIIPTRTTHLVDGIAQVDQKATNQLILVEVPDTDTLPSGLRVKRGVAKTSSHKQVDHTAPSRKIMPTFDLEKLKFRNLKASSVEREIEMGAGVVPC